MGNNYLIGYNFENCSEETVEIVDALVRGGCYCGWTQALEEDATLWVERKMRDYSWKEDQKVHAACAVSCFPEKLCSLRQLMSMGCMARMMLVAGPLVGTLADYVERFFE